MRSNNQQIAEILEAAAMVVSLPDWHCKGSNAVNYYGGVVSPGDPQACRFCAVGAIAAAAKGAGLPGSYIREAREAVQKRMGNGQSLMLYNDSSKRNLLDLAELLYETAQGLK